MSLLHPLGGAVEVTVAAEALEEMREKRRNVLAEIEWAMQVSPAALQTPFGVERF